MGAINKREIILAIIHSIINYSKAFDKIDFTTFQIFQNDINKWKNYSKAKLTSRPLMQVPHLSLMERILFCVKENTEYQELWTFEIAITEW